MNGVSLILSPFALRLVSFVTRPGRRLFHPQLPAVA